MYKSQRQKRRLVFSQPCFHHTALCDEIFRENGGQLAISCGWQPGASSIWFHSLVSPNGIRTTRPCLKSFLVLFRGLFVFSSSSRVIL